MTDIKPANPYLVCGQCQEWITHFSNTGDHEGGVVNQPCGHRADHHNRCPSWGPVDGCWCQESLGYVPHGEPPNGSPNNSHYNKNGDMVVKPPNNITLRRVGWIIFGGPNDGLLVKEFTDEHKSVPHGSFAPVYIEIGD